MKKLVIPMVVVESWLDCHVGWPWQNSEPVLAVNARMRSFSAKGLAYFARKTSNRAGRDEALFCLDFL